MVDQIYFLFTLITFHYAVAIPIDNSLVEPRNPPNALPTDSAGNVQCKEVAEPFDLEVMIDGSSSVGEEDFKKIKRFLINVIQGFTIGPGQVQVGVVQFSGTTRTEFSLNRYPNYQDLMTGIEAIAYLKGTTKTGAAILHVLNNELVADMGKRPNVKTVITVLTDGSSQDNISEAAAMVRKRGFSLLAVAITPDVNFQQLLEMTGGDSSKVFQIDSFSDLQQNFRNTFVTKVCNEIKKNTTHLYVTVSTSNTTSGSAGPQIVCAQNQIQISAETKKPFGGNIFVKGYSSDPKCSKSYIKLATTTSIGMEIDISKCGVIRSRQLSPPGMSYEAVVIISFHHLFVTKVDKAFRIQCFFMEATKTVSQSFDVSMLTTEFITHTAPMPVCIYSTRKGSAAGDVVRYASVGDKIFHIWECSAAPGETSAHNILIHNCKVDDGQGKSIKVLDEFGCTLDRYVMPELSYDSSGSKAMTETHAFKFADHNLLVFMCEISICLKGEPTCASITPPNCNGSGTAGVRSEQATTDSHLYFTTANYNRPEFSYQPPTPTLPYGRVQKDNFTVGTFDAFSRFSVLDVENSADTAAFERDDHVFLDENFDSTATIRMNSGGKVCLAPAVVILLSGLIVIITVAICGFSVQHYLRRRHCSKNFATVST